ncbi:MAG: hypothetical protein ACI8QZ_003893 [Chlamydiales bacterium]|jgi:hypothetical protein
MKNVLIIGSGKRVQEAALPAFFRTEEHFRVRGIYARTEKEITVEERSLQVERLLDLEQRTVDEADLIYMVVGKNAVPAVLATLCKLNVSNADLLIDTPVLRFKHLGHLGLLDAFRNTWVPEDCTTLPVYDVIEAFFETGAIGDLKRVLFDRSAYAYHGIAMGRRLFSAGRVRSAKQSKRGNGELLRTIRFERDGELAIVSPRDYGCGHVTLEGTRGSVSDDPRSAAGHRLTALLDGQACTGFAIDSLKIELTAAERSLMGSPKPASSPEPGIWIWMEGMKRVGFLRLLKNIADGKGAYPLAHAVEDTVVDYHLEKIRCYISNPFTSAHFASARFLMKLLTRLAGK